MAPPRSINPSAHGIPPRSRACGTCSRRRRVQSTHRLVGYLAGHEHGCSETPPRSIKPSARTSHHEHDSMFSGAAAFNQPIGSWDTSKVTTCIACSERRRRVQSNYRLVEHLVGHDMGSMFYGAAAWQAGSQQSGGYDNSTHSACSEFTSYTSSANPTDGPPAAWVRKDNACDAAVPPANGAAGTCNDTLASGSSCQPACDTGYTVSGTSSCLNRVLTSATCTPTPCDASLPPANGAVGDCTRLFGEWLVVHPRCNATPCLA